MEQGTGGSVHVEGQSSGSRSGPLSHVRILDFSALVAGPMATQILGDLGADVIKADPTDNVAVYHKVIEAASGIPVLVRGGGKVGDREILQRTHELLAQGASGIVYGRNIIQHAKPAAITRALMGLVHDGLSVDAAFDLLSKG